MEKLVLMPTTKIRFLGLIVDLIQMALALMYSKEIRKDTPAILRIVQCTSVI